MSSDKTEVRTGCLKRCRLVTNGFVVLVVMIGAYLLSILFSVVFFEVRDDPSRARISAVQTTMGIILSAASLYYQDCGKWPNPDTGLDPLIVRPSDETQWNGPYLLSHFQSHDYQWDSWGNRYKFQVKEMRLTMVSAGSDGVYDTEDDIFGSISPEQNAVVVEIHGKEISMDGVWSNRGIGGRPENKK